MTTVNLEVDKVTNDQERLALALESLADQIASAPRTIIGNKVSVSVGPGSSGTVIGQRSPRLPDRAAEALQE
jgi:hypothetical protein